MDKWEQTKTHHLQLSPSAQSDRWICTQTSRKWGLQALKDVTIFYDQPKKYFRLAMQHMLGNIRTMILRGMNSITPQRWEQWWCIRKQKLVQHALTLSVAFSLSRFVFATSAFLHSSSARRISISASFKETLTSSHPPLWQAVTYPETWALGICCSENQLILLSHVACFERFSTSKWTYFRWSSYNKQ